MNEIVKNIAWVIIGTLAFLELARIYYRIYILEKTMNRCVDVVEQIAMSVIKPKAE